MNSPKILRICTSYSGVSTMNYFQTRLFSNSILSLAGARFREARGQAADGYSYGPLTDSPDWTYVADKPTVMTKRQKLRQMRRLKIASDITRMLREVDEQKVDTKYGILEKGLES